jgi:tRNA dimethylallyltransferase
MDIVTGKDHPKGVAIFGTDIVSPNESCSVAIWYESVMPHIALAWEQGKLPIVVGGTGLYIKAITEGIETMQMPINQELRDELIPLSILELQNKLKFLDSVKFESMNHSDQSNPRRLVRAIEVVGHGVRTQKILCDSELIGLKYFDNSNYRSKIMTRVLDRLKIGALEETKLLLYKYGENIQSMSAIGYRSIIKYLEKDYSEQEMIETWVKDELSYAKRQMTWFRKQPVIWYDVDTYGN